MTAKKKITEKGVLDSEMRLLMTPVAVEELKVLSPTMQQFLLRWQDHRDIILGDQLKEELKAFLIGVYEKDNIEMCKNVTNVVCKQLAETLTPFAETLNRVERNIQIISADVSVIKTDIIEIRKRLKYDEDLLIKLENRVTHLEKYASIGWTVIRNIITAIVAIGTSIIAFLEVHKNLKP